MGSETNGTTDLGTDVDDFEAWKEKHLELKIAIEGQLTRMGRYIDPRSLDDQVATRLRLARVVADRDGDIAALCLLFPGREDEVRVRHAEALKVQRHEHARMIARLDGLGGRRGSQGQ